VAIKAPSTFSKFDEAIAWFLARIVLDRGEFDRLKDNAKRQAFTVSNLSSLRMVDQVFREIARSLDKAEGRKAFKKRMIPMLQNDWGRGLAMDAAGRRINVGARLDTIYRTNVLGAYNEGRYEQMNRPVVKKMRPYWMYDAIMDSRTTAICSGRDKKVFAADDPWWDTNYPPLHYNCRSGVRAITARRANKEGVSSQADLWSKDKDGNIVPAGDPLAGFGNAPDIGAKVVAQADISKVNETLVNIYNEKEARTLDK